MHYQLWDTASANVIDVYRTEAESLAMVRGLLKAGWNADHLALGLDFDVDEPGDDADLPSVLSGTALAARAQEMAAVTGGSSA